jgi:dienelactone hydrolase
MTARVYEDFERREVALLGETREVFVKGEGPAIVVMHEVPGLYPGVADFARRVVDAGFSVYMPSLFGTAGRAFSVAYNIETMARACVSREFTMFATRKNSPLTEWLRALGKLAWEERGGAGVGAVGMCLTGGFALAMMVDDHLLAPALSQPSLPLGILPAQRRDLGIDDVTLARVKERAQNGSCVMGLRFTRDPLVPEERFARLREELGDAFLAIEIDSSVGNPHDFSFVDHSILSLSFRDEPGHPTRVALDRLLAFFAERLL